MRKINAEAEQQMSVAVERKAGDNNKHRYEERRRKKRRVNKVNRRSQSCVAVAIAVALPYAVEGIGSVLD